MDQIGYYVVALLCMRCMMLLERHLTRQLVQCLGVWMIRVTLSSLFLFLSFSFVCDCLLEVLCIYSMA